MIMASVTLYHPNATTNSGASGFKFLDISPIHEWLLSNVGENARFRDLVDEERPWHTEHYFGYIVFSFAREHDATMFSLRWS